MAQQQGRMIRRVTRVDIIRGKQGDGQPGSYQFELELDNGTDQYLLTPAGEEVDTVLRLFARSGSVLFDQRTEELTFEGYGAVGS